MSFDFSIQVEGIMIQFECFGNQCHLKTTEMISFSFTFTQQNKATKEKRTPITENNNNF